MPRLAFAAFLLATLAHAAPEKPPWETWQPPAVTYPQPNAYDTYLKAIELKKAVDAQHAVREWPKGEKWFEGPPDLPLAQRVALYAEVLKLLGEAVTQDCRIPPSKGIGDVNFPFEAYLREFARLLHMASAARLEAGDATGAAQVALDGVRIGQHAATGRTLISYLSGEACSGIAIAALDEAVPHLDAAGCRATLDRLKHLIASLPLLSEAFEGEELEAYMTLKAVASAPDGAKEYLEGDVPDEQLAHLSRTLTRDTWDELPVYYAALRHWADLPYWHMPKPPAPKSLLLKMDADNYARLRYRAAQNQTLLQLRLALVAARGFEAAEGHLPGSLDALVPGWLPEAPADPFGDGPLRSRPGRTGLVIYSIGPDGFDNKGTMAGKPARWSEAAPGDIAVRLR